MRPEPDGLGEPVRGRVSQSDSRDRRQRSGMLRQRPTAARAPIMIARRWRRVEEPGRARPVGGCAARRSAALEASGAGSPRSIRVQDRVGKTVGKTGARPANRMPRPRAMIVAPQPEAVEAGPACSRGRQRGRRGDRLRAHARRGRSDDVRRRRARRACRCTIPRTGRHECSTGCPPAPAACNRGNVGRRGSRANARTASATCCAAASTSSATAR